ncbi:MAG TPA: cell division protein FtsZ [Stellaceae bacterium]
MTISLTIPHEENELKPRITVIGVGGAGGNAVNNMIRSNLIGCDFVICNTDAQAMQQSLAERRIQLGVTTTRGLGAGSRPEVGRSAAEEALDEIMAAVEGANMVFITAGMGGGTGTGAAPVIARAAREAGILTVGVVTKPFQFEGSKRMKTAEQGIQDLQAYVDTLIIIPNQNLFRIANERTTFVDAFKMADDVLHAGVRGVTDLMVMPGLINLDFADVRAVMSEMGKAMMGTGEAEGDRRAIDAAEAAISNPLLDDVSMKGARGILINVTGGLDMTLFEFDEAANRIREEVDPEANIIVGSTLDETLTGKMRISVVATGIDAAESAARRPMIQLVTENDHLASPARLEPMEEMPHAAPAVAAMAPAPLPHTQPHAAQHLTEPTLTRTNAIEREAAKRDSFIVPPPSEVPGGRPAYIAQPAIAPDAYAAAAMENGGHPPQKGRSQRPPSLFERVKGVGRQRAAADPELTSWNQQPGQRAGQARLGAVDQADRILPPKEEELLDIPAFLRRQAN